MTETEVRAKLAEWTGPEGSWPSGPPFFYPNTVQCLVDEIDMLRRYISESGNELDFATWQETTHD